MLLKLSPLILLLIAGAAIILRSVGLLGDLTTSIVIAILIVIAIAIGVYRSVKTRKANSSQ
jgi:membrane protein implicated in regulation of membrane protease activity